MRVEYQIAGGYGRSEAEAQIQEKLEHGWKPLGGVAVDGADFYQAMIRYVDDSMLSKVMATYDERT